MVAPPHGVRTPIDGAQTQPLAVGGFAPVKPVMPSPVQWPQPQQQGGWAPPQAAPVVPAVPPLEARLHPNDRANVVEGIRAGASVAEILPYFAAAQLTVDDLRVIAKTAGLVLNEGQGSVQVPASQQPLPPPAAAQQPVQPTQAGGPVVEKVVQRITKKHWPAIEALVTQGASAAQIAQQLGLPESGVERACKELAKARGQQQPVQQAMGPTPAPVAETGAMVGHPPPIEEPAAARDTSVAQSFAASYGAADDVTNYDQRLLRSLEMLEAVRALGRERGYSYQEIEAAAGLLHVTRS